MSNDKPRNPDKRSDWIEEVPSVQAAEVTDKSGHHVAAVPVEVVGTVATTTDAVIFGIYSCFLVAPLQAVKLLSYDQTRQYARVMGIDQPIVMATSQGQAQAVNNTLQSGTPPAVPASGAYLPAGALSPEIRHNDEIWAVNTSSTAATRVSVWVESGNGQ